MPMFTGEVVKYVVNESQKIPKKVDILEFPIKAPYMLHLI